jgi:16S rRNA processing protein RimM
MTQPQSAHDSDYVVIGQVGATYGIKGWLKILSFTEQTTDIVNYTPWYLEQPTGWQPFKVEDSRPHGKGVVAKLAGFNNPEQAKLLSSKKIAILRSQLPKLAKGEYYWSDLKGLTVIDQHGAHLGKIIYLIETGSNDVIVVKGEREHAIPYLLNDVIKSIDLEKGEMHVDWEVII